jgi:hypothetical protein
MTVLHVNISVLLRHQGFDFATGKGYLTLYTESAPASHTDIRLNAIVF